MEKKKQNFDELELGLDPNKYSQKPFNPARIVYPEKSDDSKALELEMQRQRQLREEQRKVMGGTEVELEPPEEEKQKNRELMMKKFRGF